jgi:hypothetical protein
VRHGSWFSWMWGMMNSGLGVDRLTWVDGVILFWDWAKRWAWGLFVGSGQKKGERVDWGE